MPPSPAAGLHCAVAIIITRHTLSTRQAYTTRRQRGEVCSTWSASATWDPIT
ncbi:hypothetical protein F751_3667 [Auxenochlorella protothecoides]|uniref:Uncharacterized protein n=1 Tax=Auxenochlorella protothecoides TaxID=3075 RepID=A0A087SJX5_AUXPR|nr:hypothetical protein F751_3667 [Auxenochlorella protothecoides]KFM26029.1 hypothetical protein F751_3667 [Auxenochlorella protothecoides]